MKKFISDKLSNLLKKDLESIPKLILHLVRLCVNAAQENFTVEIIERCKTQAELNEREIFWIKVLKSKTPNRYNLTDDGAGFVKQRVLNLSKIRDLRLKRGWTQEELGKLLNVQKAAVSKYLPKNSPTNVVQRHIITPEKLAELLAKYPFGSPYYIPILILFHTGMRISEVLGLTWNDIDFEKKIITVDKQVV